MNTLYTVTLTPTGSLCAPVLDLTLHIFHIPKNKNLIHNYKSCENIQKAVMTVPNDFKNDPCNGSGLVRVLQCIYTVRKQCF